MQTERLPVLESAMTQIADEWNVYAETTPVAHYNFFDDKSALLLLRLFLLEVIGNWLPARGCLELNRLLSGKVRKILQF